MKVKELISLLEKQNREYFVNRYDIGFDSGDLMELRKEDLVFTKELKDENT